MADIAIVYISELSVSNNSHSTQNSLSKKENLLTHLTENFTDGSDFRQGRNSSHVLGLSCCIS